MDVSPRLKAGLRAFGALTGVALLAYAANVAFGFASGLDGFFEDYLYNGLIVAAGRDLPGARLRRPRGARRLAHHGRGPQRVGRRRRSPGR